MRVVIVDNFDSFTHNLAQAFGGLGAEVSVVRNDVRAPDVLALAPDRIVLSPGPGGPDRTGSCAEIVTLAAGGIPVLGVCLGMQLLASLAGARVVRAAVPVHGRATALRHDGSGLFLGIASPCPVGRYHSLVVDEASLPSEWEATAWSGDVLMGMTHAAQPMVAVQFHPESILTPDGPRMLANFLERRWMRTSAGEPPR